MSITVSTHYVRDPYRAIGTLDPYFLYEAADTLLLRVRALAFTLFEQSTSDEKGSPPVAADFMRHLSASLASETEAAPTVSVPIRVILTDEPTDSEILFPITWERLSNRQRLQGIVLTYRATLRLLHDAEQRLQEQYRHQFALDETLRRLF